MRNVNCIVLSILVLFVPMAALAGNLDSPAAPTDADSAMYTLEDIYNRLNDGSAGSKRLGAFAEPLLGPTAGAGHTLDDLMGKAPSVDDTNGAGVADVLADKTFWGLTSGNWGVKTGTVTAGSNVSGAEGLKNFTIPDGLYSGSKTATANDSDLTGGNIKDGVTIFGVTGTFPSDGTAVAGEVKTGSTFYTTSGVKLTGNGTKELSAANDAVNAGYYEATTLSAVDADLATGNIKAGKTIFGVAGDTNVVNTSSGDASAGDILKDKKAWVNGSELSGTRYGGCTCIGALNGTRWCDNGDGTVTDLTTCLVWLKNASWGAQYAFWVNEATNTNAHDRAAQLKNGVGGLTDGSVEGDWRLPTKTELHGLANGTEEVRSGTPRAFTGVQSAYHWSSTTYESNTYYAWGVSMGDGGVRNFNKDLDAYVWPVRSGN